jgi:hypothetical protein
MLVGEPEGISACLVAYAGLALACGDCTWAINLCAVAETLLQTNQTRLAPYDRAHFGELLATLRQHTPALHFATA